MDLFKIFNFLLLFYSVNCLHSLTDSQVRYQLTKELTTEACLKQEETKDINCLLNLVNIIENAEEHDDVILLLSNNIPEPETLAIAFSSFTEDVPPNLLNKMENTKNLQLAKEEAKEIFRQYGVTFKQQAYYVYPSLFDMNKKAFVELLSVYSARKVIEKATYLRIVLVFPSKTERMREGKINVVKKGINEAKDVADLIVEDKKKFVDDTFFFVSVSKENLEWTDVQMNEIYSWIQTNKSLRATSLNDFKSSSHKKRFAFAFDSQNYTNIRDLILSQTRGIKKKLGDIRYPVTGKVKDFILKVSKQVSKSVTEDLKVFKEKIKNYLSNAEKKISIFNLENVQFCAQNMKTIADSLLTLEEKMNSEILTNLKEIAETFRKLQEVTGQMYVDQSLEKVLERIFVSFKLYEFMKSISDFSLDESDKTIQLINIDHSLPTMAKNCLKRTLKEAFKTMSNILENMGNIIVDDFLQLEKKLDLTNVGKVLEFMKSVKRISDVLPSNLDRLISSDLTKHTYEIEQIIGNFNAMIEPIIKISNSTLNRPIYWFRMYGLMKGGSAIEESEIENVLRLFQLMYTKIWKLNSCYKDLSAMYENLIAGTKGKDNFEASDSNLQMLSTLLSTTNTIPTLKKRILEAVSRIFVSKREECMASIEATKTTTTRYNVSKILTAPKCLERNESKSVDCLLNLVSLIDGAKGRDEIVLIINNGISDPHKLAADLSWNKLNSLEYYKFKAEGQKASHNYTLGSAMEEAADIFGQYSVLNGNTSYYIYPGFDRSRRSLIEILAFYSAKKAIDQATTMRLVLAYPFIKSSEVKPDGRKLILNITEELTSAMYKIVERKTNPKQKAFFIGIQPQEGPKADSTNLKFLEALKPTIAYGYFGVDDKCSIFQYEDQNHAEVSDLISSHATKFKVDSRSISYPLTDEGKKFLGKISVKVFNAASKDLETLDEKLLNHFLQVEKTLNSKDLEKVFEFEENLKEVSDLLAFNIKKKLNPEVEHDRTIIMQTLEKIKSVTKSMNAPDLEEVFSRISASFSIYGFMKTATTIEVTGTEAMFSKIEKQLIRTQKLSSWYQSLRTVYESRLLYNVTKIHEILDPKLEILNSQINFIDANLLSRTRIFEEVKKVIFDVEKKCVRLKGYVDSGLYRLDIIGTTVTAKDVPKTELCPGKTNMIQIFASDMFTVNGDLDFSGKGISISIAAPIWLVTEVERVISLNGIDGSEHRVSKAANGDRNGNRNGADGKPGKSGTNAGNFYGIAGRIFNENMLTISASGGQGTNGQSGGDGVDGKAGKIFRCSYVPSNSDSDHCDDTQVNSDLTVTGFPTILKDHKMHTLGSVNEFTYYYYITVYGKRGTDGGRGGNGGAGGRGGKAGSISFFELDNNCHTSPVSMIALDGRDGVDGVGGSGGRAGERGGNVDLIIDEPTQPFAAYDKYVILDAVNYFPETLDGANGKNGSVLEWKKFLKPPSVLQSFPDTLVQFKTFLISKFPNMGNDMRLKHLYGTINKCDRNNVVYDLVHLVNELAGLEGEYVYFKNKLDTLFLYQSLLERIEEYKVSKKGEQESDENKIEISRLENMIDERIRIVKYHAEAFVSNVKSGFNRNVDGVKAYKEFNAIASVRIILHRYTENLDMEIEEMQDAVDDEIPNSLADFNRDLDRSIQNLIVETVELSNQTDKNVQELEKKRQEMAGKVLMKFFYGVAQSICQMVSTAGTVYAIAGVTTESALNIMEPSIFPEDSEFQSLVLNTPDIVKQGLQAVQLRNQGIMNSVMSVLSSHQYYLDKRKENVFDSTLLDETKSQIEELKKNASTFEESRSTIFRQEVDLLTSKIVMQKQKYKHMEENTTFMETINEDIGILNHLVKVAQAAQYGGESILDTREDDSFFNELEIAQVKNIKTMETLASFENDIYRYMTPAMSEMKKMTSKVAGKIALTKRSDLELFKLNVTVLLEDVMRNLESFTKGFTTADYFKHTLNKLKKTIQTLIRVQENIHETKKMRDFGELVANLQQINYNASLIGNSQLGLPSARLQVLSQSNKLVQFFHEWFNSFKLYAFPCAYYFLGKPQPQENTRALETEAHFVANKIASVKNFFTSENTLLNVLPIETEDNFVYSLESNPFYEWYNKTNFDDIAKLLRGEIITLKANLKEFQTIEAVQFESINIDFYSNNRTLLTQMKTDLKRFNLELEHSGKSYFWYDNAKYKVDSHPVKFELNWRNAQIREMDFLLSPYTEWTMQIKRGENAKFTVLEKYIGKVDMGLVGKGHHIKKDTEKNKQCSINTEYYYHKITSD